MLLNALASAFDRRSWTISGGHPRDPAIADMLGLGATTKAGIVVTEKTAVTFSAVFRATNLRGMAMGYLPLEPFLRKADNSREKLTGHPLYRILHDTVNEDLQISAFSFRQWCESKVCLWGNAYAWIERKRNGQPVALWPQHPNAVTPDLTRDGALRYIFHGVREPDRTYLPFQVIHQKGVGDDPLVGWSRIRQARESLGQAMAAQQYGSAWFGQGARMGAIATTLPGFRQEDKDKLLAAIAKQTMGPENWHRPFLLPGVDKIVPVTVPAEDAQFLGTQEHGVADVGRWFDVPLVFLMLPNSEPRANVEQDSLNFIVWTIGPWCRNYEQEYNQKLLLPSERDSMFIEHNLDALLRGDFKTRMEGYAIGRAWGLTTINDYKRRENENPIGPEGDVAIVPATHMNAKVLVGQTKPPGIDRIDGKAKERPDDEPLDEDKPDDERAVDWLAMYGPLFADGGGRLLNKERKAIEAIMGKAKSHSDMAGDIAAFYHGHRDAVRYVFGPIIRSMATIAAQADSWIEQFAERYCVAARAEQWPAWQSGKGAEMIAAECRGAIRFFKVSNNGRPNDNSI